MPLPQTEWHKSSYSTQAQEACVEACRRPDGSGVLVRDSKDPARAPLTISAPAWNTFLGAHRDTVRTTA